MRYKKGIILAAGKGTRLIIDKDKLIEEASVTKTNILLVVVSDEETTFPLICPKPIGPIALGPSKIGFVDLFIIPIIEK